jgi:hypothetical protein
LYTLASFTNASASARRQRNCQQGRCGEENNCNRQCNDGVHEINAGGALPLPVDWNRRHGQPQVFCLRQKAAPDAVLDEPSTLHPF